VMGCYYISTELPNRKGEGMIFSSGDEAELAFSQGKLDLHAKIKLRLPKHQKLKSDEDDKHKK